MASAEKITCSYCNKSLPGSHFLSTKDFLFPKGKITICTQCLNNMVSKSKDEFTVVDRICQWLGIPFIPDQWIETKNAFGDSAIEIYYKMYCEQKFDYINWSEAYKYYKELEESGMLTDNIAPLSKAEIRKLRDKWGQEYTDEEELKYLEHLYQDILDTYSIFGGNQLDQVKKICKISLIINQKIQSGEPYDKDIKSYNDLCKMANLEPKNIKDATDFSSVGEIFAYLEKNDHWINEFYNGVENDIVDKTMKDIQNWSRTLYINDSSIPAEVENRIAALKMAEDMEEEMNRLEDDGLDDTYNEEFDPSAGVE